MAHLVAPEAEHDLDDIWYYIAINSGSIEIADRFIDSLTHRFYLLSNHPHIGRRRDEELSPGIRSFPVREYIILYKLLNDEVLIVRVLHGSREIELLFGN